MEKILVNSYIPDEIDELRKEQTILGKQAFDLSSSRKLSTSVESKAVV